MREPGPNTIRILARLRLRVAGPEELVDWAVAERMAGGGTPYLTRLADVGGALGPALGLAEAQAWFEGACADAGYALPPGEAALRGYAQQLAGALVLDTMDPFQACGLLCRIWLELGQPADLAPWGFLDDGFSADGRVTLSPGQAAEAVRGQAQVLLEAVRTAGQ